MHKDLENNLYSQIEYATSKYNEFKQQLKRYDFSKQQKDSENYKDQSHHFVVSNTNQMLPFQRSVFAEDSKTDNFSFSKNLQKGLENLKPENPTPLIAAKNSIDKTKECITQRAFKNFQSTLRQSGELKRLERQTMYKPMHDAFKEVTPGTWMIDSSYVNTEKQFLLVQGHK